jgi:GNAT superfamily N-acetyltransferase
LPDILSLSTDKLVFDLDDKDEQRRKEKRDAWRKFNKKHGIHYNKHRRIYPAIKIGRLAVANAFAGKGLGRYLIKSIVSMIIDMDRVGCRFITVDAYRNALDFYLKNDFNFLYNDDTDEETRVMYVDINRFCP